MPSGPGVGRCGRRDGAAPAGRHGGDRGPGCGSRQRRTRRRPVRRRAPFPPGADARRCRPLGSVGLPEILLIAAVALVIFGPARLPEVGRAVGRAMREFRSAMRGIDEDEPAATGGPSARGRGVRRDDPALDPQDGAGERDAAGGSAATPRGGEVAGAGAAAAQGGNAGASGVAPAEDRGERRQGSAG
ncbi:MAG: hypothetical protein DIU76_04725 [Bacillota bacterium]|nr:MAG: hypothetical protein DIU76_04725 [Bacillota bacterium]